MSSDAGIVNEADIEWSEASHGDTFEMRHKGLGREAGGTSLGCSLYQVPPNKRPFPLHYHVGTEEAMYVLSGEGTLRTLDDEVEIHEGDYIAFPAGEDGAHQVINTSDEPITYLCFASHRDPDVVLYPDSDKVLVQSRDSPELDKMLPGDTELDYWDGE